MPVEKYTGEFWSRAYESDVDLSDELINGSLNSVIRCAFADACMAVEPPNAGLEPGSLASVKIFVENGRFTFVASSGGNSYAVTTGKCDKCEADTYAEFHPFNGCDAVLIEEIMSS